MKQYWGSGITLIEVIIAISMLGIILSISIPVLLGGGYKEPTRCIAGYVFTMDNKQVFNGMGQGIPCNTSSDEASPKRPSSSSSP